MDVKIGTKTFSQAQQVSNFKPDNVHTLSPTEKKANYDDKDIGEVLNKISDPNWVDPQKKIRTTGNNQLDKEAFMKLLLTQMKNQDPMNPMESHEMATQLAQFTSLEKLTNIDDSIRAQTKAAEPGLNFDSLKLIGKVVGGDSANILRENDDEIHSIRLNALGDVKDLQVEIRDEGGQTIRTLNKSRVSQGRVDIEWNGLLEDGQKARAGNYKVIASGIGTNGRGVGIETGFEGVVTGVTFGKGGPTLMVGNQKVIMSDIKNIADPVETEKAQQLAAQFLKKPTTPAADLQKFIPIPESKSVASKGDTYLEVKK